MSQTVAQLTVEFLIANGIRNLYCVPGVQNDPFFNAIFDRTGILKPIQARHEQGAVYMALGAALATGKPQAFSLVPGPGFLNGCAALCTAYALNAPLFGVIGQIQSDAIGKEFGLLHEIEGQLETLKSLTKHADRVVSGTQANAQFRDAWLALHNGRPRPVAVEVPVNIWRSETGVDKENLKVTPLKPSAIAPDLISEAADLISNAERPLIAVGSGAQDHSDDVRFLAKSIDAGVMAFRTGHGVMDSRDPLAITMPVGHALWAECDLVIGLGTRLTTQKLEWGVDENLKILHIDLDADVLARICAPMVGINANLGDALPQIQSALNEQPDRSQWSSRIAEKKSIFAQAIADELAPQLDWLNAIRDAMPEEGIFVDELTQIGYVSRFAFPCYSPRTFLSTGYQGTLGWGIASAIGAAHARRDVPVVSIAGDGGAMFTISELASAAHHNIPINIIVMNDNAFGNVRSIQRDNYDARFVASDLSSPDFVKLAESCGVHGMRATTPDELRYELSKAIANQGPNLIEVPVGEFPSPWKYILMPKLRGLRSELR